MTYGIKCNHSSGAEKHELENVLKTHITKNLHENKKKMINKGQKVEKINHYDPIFGIQDILLTPNAFASLIYQHVD